MDDFPHPPPNGFDKLAAWLNRIGNDGHAPEFDGRHAALSDANRRYQAAAVLIGFVPDDSGNSADILLTVRQTKLHRHGGQIAFPGGRLDPTDRDETAAALRETHEELGIPPDTWHIHGSLPHCFLPSGYRVRPVLAGSVRPVRWQANPAEVAEVFRLPATVALDPAAYVREPHSFDGKTLALPVLYWQQYRIWGATAAILRQLAAKTPFR